MITAGFESVTAVTHDSPPINTMNIAEQTHNLTLNALSSVLRHLRPTAHTLLQNECSFVRKFLAERTTIWREPFWALLSKRGQLKVAQCVKLRMVPSDGEPHDFVAADSASGCMIFVPIRGAAQVRKLLFVDEG